MMYPRFALFTLLSLVAAAPSAFAQQAQKSATPHTEYAHPDFQGVWGTAFLTMLERPPGVEGLVATPQQAETLVAMIRKMAPAVNDPDFTLHNIQQLAMVKGEYRTSMIVDPVDGHMPFTPASLDRIAQMVKSPRKFDNPEDRPLSERCLENLSYAPIRTVPVFLPRQIVQTRDYLVISAEDSSGARVINLHDAPPPPDSLRSIGGYSTGHWEGDTLVVRTTNLRADQPRNVVGRAMLISPRTTITERFTRVSEKELVYQFTVEDPELYTRPWTGEFSLTKYDGPIYEYACHEGNYSLPNILRGGQAEATRAEEAKRSTAAVVR